MKTAVFASLLATAAAFAPAQQGARSTAIQSSTEFDGMIGVSTETGGKFVSFEFCHRLWEDSIWLGK